MFLLAAYANMEPNPSKRQCVGSSSAPIVERTGRQQPFQYYILLAANFASMTLDLLPEGMVSVSGGPPHGEWRREGELLIVRWHSAPEEAKAKTLTYDPVASGVMKSRVQDVRFCNM